MLLQPFRVAATTAAADVVALLKTVLPPLAPAIVITLCVLVCLSLRSPACHIYAHLSLVICVSIFHTSVVLGTTQDKVRAHRHASAFRAQKPLGLSWSCDVRGNDDGGGAGDPRARGADCGCGACRPGSAGRCASQSHDANYKVRGEDAGMRVTMQQTGAVPDHLEALD